ncbi:MAG: dienelactone hydrolase family protein [Nevskia sp.]|nr:dienelactone hydrolase family protein [Nevskia sp.]
MDQADLSQSQADSLLRPPGLSRRAFVAAGLGAGLGAGFALAVQPVAAQSLITTDAQGLVAGMVEVPVADGRIPAYRAYPQARAAAPVVLVIHEVFGVHEHIRDLCRRLAKQGYYAISADLFARYGDATAIADVQQLLATVVHKATDTQVKDDLDATVRFAAGEKADAARLAVTGFCWGGRQAWLYTAATPAVKAAAAWYGALTAAPPGGRTVLSAAAAIHGRVIGFYGGQDQGIDAASIAQMRATLAAAGDSATQIRVYPDAPHGFNADYRPSYRAADAKDAWSRMLAWFQAHGVA